MADLISRISALQNDFQRRADRVPWVRACWETADGRLSSFQLGHPPSDEGSEAILEPQGRISAERHATYAELFALTEIAANLTERILRTRRFKWTPVVLEPVIEALRPIFPDEVWLRFVMFVQPDRFQYLAGAFRVGQDTGLVVYSDGKSSHHGVKTPDGTNLVFFGQGAVTGWIDNYPRVCVGALAKLMAGLRATSGQKEKAAVPSAGDDGGQIVELMMKVAITVGGETAGKMIAIAGDKEKSVDQRQREIYSLDNRVLGWTGNRWAELLSVTGCAARKTDWWRADRVKLRGCD